MSVYVIRNSYLRLYTSDVPTVARTGNAEDAERLDNYPMACTEIPRYGCRGTRHGMTLGWVTSYFRLYTSYVPTVAQATGME
jgi:hypothetical protein